MNRTDTATARLEAALSPALCADITALSAIIVDLKAGATLPAASERPALVDSAAIVRALESCAADLRQAFEQNGTAPGPCPQPVRQWLRLHAALIAAARIAEQAGRTLSIHR